MTSYFVQDIQPASLALARRLWSMPPYPPTLVETRSLELGPVAGIPQLLEMTR
ncbi:MAG: hypothetical protein ABIG63_15855 [Chloroflexota bacterium]